MLILLIQSPTVRQADLDDYRADEVLKWSVWGTAPRASVLHMKGKMESSLQRTRGRCDHGDERAGSSCCRCALFPREDPVHAGAGSTCQLFCSGGVECRGPVRS